MTAQERLDQLLSIIETPTNTPVTLAMIRDALPIDGYVLVRLTLEAAKVPADATKESQFMATEMMDAIAALRSDNGLLISSPDRQAIIDQLAAAGKWPGDLRDTVKSFGVYKRFRWQVEGYATEPTIEEIQAAMDVAEVDQAVTTALNEIVNPAASNPWRTRKTIAEAYRKAADLVEA